MVAIVTGNGVGLGKSSSEVLGQGGQIGLGQLPGAAGNAYVNAATGNLVIRRQDEVLIGRGPDIGVYQTYNSQGGLDFDNNDNWQVSLYRQLSGLTGGSGVNTAGSTITRTGADGTALVYTYDSTTGSATVGKYVNKDGAGSYDTLSYDGTNKVWTWQDGTSRIKESYAVDPNDNSKWRITSVTDLDGNSLAYSYSTTTGLTGLIDKVTTANGEVTQLIYNASKQLTQINLINSSNVTTTRIRYNYESTATNARLTSVSTDLTPADGSISDGKTYTTSYTYDSSSKRITSITNSDGSKVSFSYEKSGDYRLLSINEYSTNSDSISNATTLNYTSATTTTVTTTNNAGTSLVTTLTYDSNKQLTNIKGPTDPQSTSSSGQNVSYTYNANGDVTQVTDSRGNWTKYSYDAQGNQVTQQDNLGNTIVRTYDSTANGFNQLLTETVYTGLDATPGDASLTGTGTAQTTRYTYDSKNHVRFTISAEGRVTEYRYNANGQLTSTHQYTDHLFTSTGNQTEAQMNTWLTAAIKSKLQRTDYLYDARGQLSETVVYTKVNATTGNEGNGIADGSQMRTQYVYDQAGNLKQKIDARGVATTGVVNDYLTSYSYDGLNRLTLTKQYDQSGLEANAVSSQVTYTDTSRQVSLTLANGLVTTSTYDLAGRLLTVQKSDATNPTVGSLGTTSYAYDKLGNLRSVTNELGKVTYYLYDNANRKVGEIDENKNLTEWVYNNNGQVVRTIQYKNAVTATLNATTALTNTLATNGIRSLDSTNDRTSYKIYDQAGRLSHEIDALGYVTEYQYDGASRLLKTVEYNTAITQSNLDLIKGSTTDIYGINGSIKGISGIATTNTLTLTADATNDRAKRNLYDNDGKLVGSLDAEGYLTEYVYDKAGRKTQMIRYATVTNASNWVTGDLATLRTNATSVSADTTKHQTTNYIYDAAGQLTGVVDAEGYLTEYQYDLAGNKTQEIRYATNITYVAGNTVEQSRPASNNEDQKVTNAYDQNNRITSSLSNTQGQVNGLLTNYLYDNVGKLLKAEKTYTGATSAQQRVQRNQYDSRGNLIAQLSGEGVVALLALGTTSTQSQVDAIWAQYGTRYTYDNGNRLLSKVEPNGVNATGNKTLYYYDNEGKLTYTVNALGEVSQTVYNSFDQVAETRRYNTRIASTTLAGLVGGDDSAMASVITGISADGYSNILLDYNKRGQLMSTTDQLTNVNSRIYNAFGELSSKFDQIDSDTSVVTSYQYDRRGSLKQTTEDDGGINRITSAIYDAFGRVTQTTDGRGNLTQYGYDKLGRTIVTTNGLSQSTTIAYDAFDRKVSQVDGRGNTTSWVYNAANRSMTMTTPEGVVMETVRNQFGETVSIKDGRGRITSYEYNADGQLTKTIEDSGDGKLNLTKSVTYDKAGRVFQTRDSLGGVPTEYTYDAANRLLSKRFWTEDTEYDVGFNIKTSYLYDAQGRQIWTQDPNGTWTKMEYDAKGQLTKITTDPSTIPTTNANGLLSGTTNKANALNLTTTYSYDARGKKLTVTEGYGSANPRTTKYTYDKFGRLKSSVIDPGSNKLNLTTSYDYDLNDNVVLKTDAIGNKTAYTYDASNRLVYTVDALGYVIKNDYDANGNIISVRAYSTPLTTATLTTLQAAPINATVTLSSQGTDRVTRYAYDKDNRLTYITDAAWYVTRKEYDANGNVVKQTRYASAATAVSDTGGVPTVGTSINDRIEQTVYDAANRVKFSIDANNYVTANSYDYFTGNLTKTVRYATAMVGALATNGPQVLESAGSGNYVVTSNADQASYYYYDAASRRVESIDAEGYLTLYGYDNLDRLTSVLYRSEKPVNVTEYGWSWPPEFHGSWREDHYTYDAAGRLSTYIKGGYMYDQRTTYTYDALGNQIEIKEPSGVVGQERITQQKFDAAGRKTEVINAEGNSTKTEYNAVGDIVKVTDALGNVGYFYTDALGRVTLQVDPEGAVTQTQYDAFGNQAEVIRYANKIQLFGTVTLGISSQIQIGGVAPSNGVYVATDITKDLKQSIAYDKLDNKLTIKTWTGATDSNAAVDYYTESYTYNAFSDVFTFTARNGQVTVYGYDKQGKKLSESFTGITVLKADNSSTTLKNIFTYDAFGNLATKVEAEGAKTSRTTTYGYDKLNRQIQATQNVQTSTGVSAAAVTQKTYDERGNLTAEKDANGNWTYHYYSFQDRRLGTVKADGTYTAWTYDVAGNIIKETRYANKVQLSGTGTLATVRPWIIESSTDPQYATGYIVPDAANDRVTKYTHDKVGRQTGTEIQNITTGVYNTASNQYQVSTGSITTKTEYDALGNIIKQTDGNGNVTRSWYNKAGQLVAKLDPENYLTVWKRDVYGNISLETRYANKVQTIGTATYTDSGIPTIVTTAPTTGNSVYVLQDSTNDRTTILNYDKLNRVSSETVNNVQAGSVNATTGVLTNPTAVNATTSYKYDGLNNIIQKTDATSAVTDWVYDGLGRQLSEIKPQFTDYEGSTVRSRTDKEYDGLNNVTRELRRGKDNATAATISGQVETDDQITTYTYGIGGRLISEKDATNAETQYEYDLNGNITKETLKNRRTADQVANSQAGADDVKTYTYDALNRQVKTTDIGTATVQEVQYNSFNQIIGKRTYTTTTAPQTATTWDEYTQYDRTGKVWKSNARDGVTKVTINDKNGNATAKITSTLNINNLTLAEVLSQKAIDTDQNYINSFAKSAYENELYNVSYDETRARAAARSAAYSEAIKIGYDASMANSFADRSVTAIETNFAELTPQTFHTYSVYDGKNQLVNTIQASMDSVRDGVSVTGWTGGTLIASTKSPGNVTQVTSSVGGVNPVTGGTVNGILQGQVSSVSVNRSGAWISGSSPGSTGGAARQDVSFDIKPGFIGKIKITVTLTASRYYQGRNYYSPLISSTTDSKTVTNPGVVSFSLSVTGPTLSGYTGSGSLEVSLTYSIEYQAERPMNGFLLSPSGASQSLSNSFALGNGTDSYNIGSSYNNLYLSGMPATTSKVVVLSNQVGNTYLSEHYVVPAKNSAGAVISGMYEINWYWTGLSSNREVQFMAFDANGKLLLNNKGRLNEGNFAQMSTASSNAGNALLTEGDNLRLFNLPAAANNIYMRYRAKGSKDNWSASYSFRKDNPGWFGIGLYRIGLKSYTNYDIVFTIEDSNGSTISQTYSDLNVADLNIPDSMYYTTCPFSVGLLSFDKTVRFTQPVNAQYLNVKFRRANTNDPYSATTRLYLASNNSGQFDFSTYGFAAGDYEFDIQATNQDKTLISHNLIIGTINAEGAFTVTSNTPIDAPYFLRVDARYNDYYSKSLNLDQLSYRPVNSTADFISLNAQYNNSYFTSELPAGLASGEYEYRYTTFTSALTALDPVKAIFKEDFNAAGQSFTLPSNGVSVTGAGTTSGSMTITGVAASTAPSTTTYEGYGSKAFVNGKKFTAQSKTGAANGRGSLFGLEGRDRGGYLQGCSFDFDGDSLYFVNKWNDLTSNEYSSRQLIAGIKIKPNTTYVIEYTTDYSSITYKIYESGQYPDSGYKSSFSFDVVNFCATSPTTYLGASSPTYDYVEGMTVQAEITTGETTGRRGLFGLEGKDNDGNLWGYSFDFDEGSLYVEDKYDGKDYGSKNRNLIGDIEIQPNTTYVIEYTTIEDGGITYTIYEKGQDPDSGFHGNFYGNFKTFHLQSYAVSSSRFRSLTAAAINAAALKVDNISVVIDRERTLSSSVYTGTFNIDVANGRSTESRVSNVQWYVSNTVSSKNIISRTQSFNAFGEIESETDGRDNVTRYTYNTLGAMTKKEAPKVSITAENGAVNDNATPTTEYTYDAIGRVIAVKDANGNLNTQVWLAGASADGNITFEKHADGGIKAAGFDIFGNKRTEYDELASSRTTSAADAIHRTDYSYDKENRLIKVEHQARNDDSGIRSTDQYSYDAAGNRISHTNAASDTEKTNYDSLGRVTKTISFMGFETSYAYTYLNNLTGVGGATVGGWQKVTTDAVGRTLIDNTDMFNHLTWHKDLGEHQFTYAYNQAGWLTSQTGTSGQNIAYSYYYNGFIKSIHDKAVGMYTYYEYDADGNKTFEGYVSLKEANNLTAGAKDYYQYATIKYDALNRITNIKDPRADISYEYDDEGNRRMVKSVYHDGVNGSMQIQEYWYKYDSMNRFLITKGTLNGARGATNTSITRGSTGVDITYNLASQRTQAINGSDNTTESYGYTNDGYLTNVTINGVLRSSRSNDALGRVTTYTENNSSGTQTYSKTTTYDKDNRITQETGTDGRTDYFYFTDAKDNTTSAVSTGKGGIARTKNDSDGDGNDGTGTIVNTYYAYQYWDDAKQFAITNQGYSSALKGNNAAWKSGYSELKYDVNGHLVGAVDRAGNRSFRYVNDAQGLVLNREESAGNMVNRVQRYYYVDGKRVGDVGNDGPSRTDYVQAMANRGSSKSDYKNWKPVSSADFDQNYEPISPSYPGFAATTYTVKNGDTLQSIARTVWGDADMWYLIADANGLTNSNTLTAGQVLTIPNKVTNIHNNSGTYRVYNPGEAIGDVNPTLPTAPPVPKKKKKGCGGFAQLIVAAVTIAVTVATYGSLGAVASAALGNIAGQVTGNVLGVQKGFDFKSFAASVATAGITEGLIGGTPLAEGGKTMGLFGSKLAETFTSTAGLVAARAVVGNVVGQGVGNLTGLQKGFSWSSVAAAGVGAAAGAFIGDKVGNALKTGDALSKTGSFITAASQGVTSSMVSQLAQIALDGKGKLSWANVAISGVSAGAGVLAGYYNPKDGGNSAKATEKVYLADNRGTVDVHTVEVYGKRPNPVDKLVDDTANRLMQINSSRKFVDSAKGDMRPNTNSSKDLMQQAGIYANAYAWAQKNGDAKTAKAYLDLAVNATNLASQAASKENAVASSWKPVAYQNSNAYGEGWSYMGSNSTGVSTMIPPDIRTQNQIASDQARIGYAALGFAMTATGVGVYGLPSLAGPSTKAIVSIGAATGGGFDVAGQYVDTKGFTTGEWRPMQTAVASVTGGLSAPYAVNFGLIGNVVLGSGVSVGNAALTNWYYQGDNTYIQKELGWEGVKGAFAGAFGFFIGDLTTSMLTKPMNPNVSILFQNYSNPYPLLSGNAVGGIVSGAAPIGGDKIKDLYLPKDKSK